VDLKLERGEKTSGAGGGFFGEDGITVLDAFCGCGGNSIAFSKLSPFSVAKIVSCDTDIVKLRNTAHNAAIYGIPCDKLILVLCNSLYVMDRCYYNGNLVESSVSSGLANEDSPFREECSGFVIGGLDLLPPNIDAIFMDPPWGGIDYNRMGKHGYDLAKHIRLSYDCTNQVGDFEVEDLSKSSLIDGEKLLVIAARATKSKFVIYDIPRNTKKQSVALAALAAGYCGNIKLEEYFLNGRLKTTTAYMGWDYSPAGRLSVLRS
jgi:trimethylguanosine synthase